MSDPLSAADAAVRIRAREITSESVVRACLDRIAAREHAVGAWSYLDPERALDAAREADRTPPRGPLHGVPIGVKDIIDTFDMPTTLGFAPYASRRPVWDAACVAACRRAGAIVLGKTVTTEFAYFSPGKTRNPHALSATPGGSSSGSAAAVADGMVPVAFGSQTAASVIRPAAFCGIVGYKASHGEFSLSGIRPFAESHDSLGILARTVADVSLVRRVLLQDPPDDAANAEVENSPPRLALCRTPHWDRLDAVARTNVEAVTTALADAGAQIDAIELTDAFATIADDHRAVMAYEAARNYAFECDQRTNELSVAFRALCDEGRRLSRTAYRGAQQRIAAAGGELVDLFGRFDAWIAPSALGEAPPFEAGTGDPLMSRIWTALHLPCLALPGGIGARGLPLGIQLVALAGMDDHLLAVGHWCAPRITAAMPVPTIGTR